MTPEETVFQFLSEYLEQLEPEQPAPDPDLSSAYSIQMSLELPLEQREFDLREEQDFEAEYEDEEDSTLIKCIIGQLNLKLLQNVFLMKPLEK